MRPFQIGTGQTQRPRSGSGVGFGLTVGFVGVLCVGVLCVGALCVGESGADAYGSCGAAFGSLGAPILGAAYGSCGAALGSLGVPMFGADAYGSCGLPLGSLGVPMLGADSYGSCGAPVTALRVLGFVAGGADVPLGAIGFGSVHVRTGFVGVGVLGAAAACTFAVTSARCCERDQ